MKFDFLNIIESKNEAEKIIEKTIKLNKKSVVNTINANILCEAKKNKEYYKAITSTKTNILDGKFISLFLSIKKMRFIEAYPGPEIFLKYIQNNDFKHMLVGGDSADVSKLISSYPHVNHISLPYKDYNDFNYDDIAQKINKVEADFIWVSLGAPKQEFFSHNLVKKINRGIIVPVGAAFNFYGSGKRAPKIARLLKLEWLYRLINDKTKKTRKRLITELKEIPSIIFKI